MSRSIDCAGCPLGAAAGPEGWAACPFARRTRRGGEILALEGDPADRLWFVKSGFVALTRGGTEHRGEGAIRAVRPPGTLAGVEALRGGNYLDTIRTLGAATLCVLAGPRLGAWLERTAALRATFELALCTLLGEGRRPERSASALERVAAWLASGGAEGASGLLPRQVIADLLGMRAETLSRALRDLADSGAIAVTRRSLRITDRALLDRIAGGADLIPVKSRRRRPE